MYGGQSSVQKKTRQSAIACVGVWARVKKYISLLFNQIRFTILNNRLESFLLMISLTTAQNIQALALTKVFIEKIHWSSQQFNLIWIVFTSLKLTRFCLVSQIFKIWSSSYPKLSKFWFEIIRRNRGFPYNLAQQWKEILPISFKR